MVYPKKVPHGIMFHHFHSEKHPQYQGSLSQEDFKRIIDYIGVERFLSPLEWLAKLAEKNLSYKDLCLTFDDGLLSQIEVALPVLEHFRLKAFWFVYSNVFEGEWSNLEIYRFFRTKYFDNIDDFYGLFLRKIFELGLLEQINPDVEEKAIIELRQFFPFYSVNDARFRFIRDRVLGRLGYEKIMDSILAEYGLNKPDLSSQFCMSNKNLKYLSNNSHYVGLHSYSHPTALATLSFQEQFEEYQKNYLHLKRVCGQNIVAMSHPCNSYNEDTFEILRQLGIRCGFRSNMFPRHEVGVLNASNFEIAREDHTNLMLILDRIE